MEPSGRNPWQPVANGTRPKAAQLAKTVAVGCNRLPITAHGKEGVDGSSPSEGFAVQPAISAFQLSALTLVDVSASTQRPRVSTALRVR
jgi:hypothetical protein